MGAEICVQIDADLSHDPGVLPALVANVEKMRCRSGDRQPLNSPPRVCDVPGAEASVVKQAASFIHEAYGLAEPLLAAREFFFDHFTAPDAHFFWCMRRGAQLGVDASPFPNCTAHFERIKPRGSVQKLFAWEKSVNEEFARRRKSTMSDSR